MSASLLTDVWITGVGALGSQGVGWDSLCELVRKPRACMQPVPKSWLEYPGLPDTFVAALAPEAETYLRAFETVSTDRACAMALAAADEAWAQARAECEPTHAGVYWGSSMGGAHTNEVSYQRVLIDRLPLRPTTVVRTMANSAAAQIAMKYRLRGPNQTYSVACASSAMALGEALLALRSGRLDLALAGGSEAMLVPVVMAAWGALRVLSTAQTAASPELPCRPFSSQRNGLVIGEGAAAFVLERAACAQARGAVPLAVLSGYGSSCDAHSLVHPSPEGQVQAMRQALADAGLQAEQIDAINAHATGTDTGDLAEAQSLAAVFGSRPVPVSATKSLHGHWLGAAGAVEAALCVVSLNLQQVPATLGLDTPDPRCAHLHLPTQPQPAVLDAVLSNSFAFGGSNVSLVFRRAPPV